MATTPTIARAVNALTNDWMFGNGLGNYVSGQAYVAQSIKTRLQSFIGDCFFDLTTGIDWFTYLSSKNQIQLQLDIRALIQNSPYVVGTALVSDVLIDSTRKISFSYTAVSVYGTIADQFLYSVPEAA